MEAEKLRKIALNYYKRKSVQNIIIEQAKNREVVPVYLKKGEEKVSKEALIVGKRPDTIEYAADFLSYIEKGATSFHISEELWKDPMKLSNIQTEQQMNELRIGWDLIIDIDTPYFEYGKIAAMLVVEALHLHNIENFGIKFSGRKGWHIGIAFEAFPKKIQNIEIKNFFPQGPRIVSSYIKEIIRKSLAERILEISTLKEISASTGKSIEELTRGKAFDPYAVLEIDTVLIAPRHLYRAAYSLNEMSGLVSCVIKPEQLKVFRMSWAFPQDVLVRPFLKTPDENEAAQLLLQALDWNTRQKEKIEKQAEKEIRKEREILKNIKIYDLKEEILPPCMKKIIEGMKYDGRKRALFLLITFSRALGINHEELCKTIEEWNKKNYKPLRESYIKSQLSWFKKQEIRAPPNCIQDYYKDLNICEPDELCRKIKNPLTYSLKKLVRKR
ncbi:MAG: hypothetical protein NZ889_01900 [Candidatus Pacearchaeota archaeon]|nr:hypothetical protein [Candidatus Pacearchaeota archaeon]